MATPKENYMHWLRDAHAMEKQSLESIEPQLKRLENYPEMKSWVQDHVDASHRHRELINQCIERNGGSTSTLKDIAMTVMGNVQELTGMLTSDEVLKNVITDYAFKWYQIASYRSLRTAAEEVGDHQTADIISQILTENERLTQRLEPLIPEMTRKYLARELVGADSKR